MDGTFPVWTVLVLGYKSQPCQFFYTLSAGRGLLLHEDHWQCHILASLVTGLFSQSLLNLWEFMSCWEVQVASSWPRFLSVGLVKVTPVLRASPALTWAGSQGLVSYMWPIFLLTEESMKAEWVLWHQGSSYYRIHLKTLRWVVMHTFIPSRGWMDLWQLEASISK